MLFMRNSPDFFCCILQDCRGKRSGKGTEVKENENLGNIFFHRKTGVTLGNIRKKGGLGFTWLKTRLLPSILYLCYFINGILLIEMRNASRWVGINEEQEIYLVYI